MNAFYGTYFNEKPPARTKMEVARLPRDVKIEIAAIAVKKTEFSLRIYEKHENQKDLVQA